MVTRRWLLIPLALVLCAQTQPATIPAGLMTAATQSAQGEIRQVVLKMLVTMREGQRENLLALCYSENPNQQRCVEATMDLGIQASRVNKIALLRWGKAGDNVMENYASESEFTRLTQAMSKGSVRIDGLSAQLEPAVTDVDNDDISTVFLKNVNGQWRVDFSRILEDMHEPAAGQEKSQSDPLARQTDFLKQQTQLIVQLGKDIEAGKYRSAREAKTAFDQQSETLAKKFVRDPDEK